MTQEEKDLLLKDICARLPYVIVHTWYNKPLDIKCTGIDLYTNTINLDIPDDDNAKVYIDNCKPYLRPMNSMTEEEVQEIRDRLNKLSIGRTITNENFEKCCDFLWFTKMSPFECVSEKMMDVVIDYLDENMFDYRGLIPMGLALEATKNMYSI